MFYYYIPPCCRIFWINYLPYFVTMLFKQTWKGHVGWLRYFWTAQRFTTQGNKISSRYYLKWDKYRILISFKLPSDKVSHQAGFTPTILRTFRAILRCRPHSSIDDANTRPLRKRKLVSMKYWGQIFLAGRIPSVGKRQTGSMAVTARGRASVHQNIAMSTTT